MPKARKSNMKGKGVVGDVLRYIKDQKLISGGLHAIGNPYYSGTVAKLIGLGKKKRAPRKRVQRGGGFLDFLGDIGRGVGSGLGGLVGNSLRGLTGGRKKKRTMRGGSMILNGSLGMPLARRLI